MQGMESAAAATAAATVALSRSDADFIKHQLLPPQKPAASVKVCMCDSLRILHAELLLSILILDYVKLNCKHTQGRLTFSFALAAPTAITFMTCTVMEMLLTFTIKSCQHRLC